MDTQIFSQGRGGGGGGGEDQYEFNGDFIGRETKKK